MLYICSVSQVGQGSNSQRDNIIADNKKPGFGLRIPQLDGPIPDPYDDALSTPNVSIFFLFLQSNLCACFDFAVCFNDNVP